MVMLRMLAFRPAMTEALAAKPVPHAHQDNAGSVTRPVNAIVPKNSAAVSPVSAPPQLDTVAAPTANLPPVGGAKSSMQETLAQHSTDNWVDMIAAMKITGLTQQLAHNCVLESIDDKTCTLLLDPGHGQLHSKRLEENLQKALQAYRGVPVKLVIKMAASTVATPAGQFSKERADKQQAAVDAINSDTNVQALKDHFDARIISGTIAPV